MAEDLAHQGEIPGFAVMMWPSILILACGELFASGRHRGRPGSGSSRVDPMRTTIKRIPDRSSMIRVAIAPGATQADQTKRALVETADRL